jgi:hypothetical protein
MIPLLSGRVTEVEQSVGTAVLFSTVTKLEERNHVTTTSIDDRQETVSLIGAIKSRALLSMGRMTARLELCSAL